MGSCKRNVLSVLFFLGSLFVFGQEDVDSLKFLNFQELFIKYSETNSFYEANRIANRIVEKAKNGNNINFLIGGYQIHALIRADYSKLIYCDSIINLKNEDVNPLFIADAYQLKADYYFNNNNYNKALDNYLIVSKYAEELDNNQYILKSKYDIGTLKRKINETEEALSLYKEGFEYAQNNRDQLDVNTYLSTITAIANIYNDMELGDSSSYYNKLGFKEATKYGKESYVKHFSLNEGVSHFYKGQYKEAIDSLEKHTPYFERDINTNNLPYAFYYSGKSHQEIGNEAVAIGYYKKVDSLFKKNQAVYSISRKSYEELISYYKKKNDLKNQLLYINQLIKVDSLLHEEELYLSKGIFKEYDIPQLESEKASIQKQMDKNKSFSKKIIFIGFTLLILSLAVLGYQYFKRINDKKKFDAIMYGIEKTPTVIELANKQKDAEVYTDHLTSDEPTEEKLLDISEETVASILDGLQTFEKEQQFLSQQTTLNSLAKELNTNSNYLSRVVNFTKKQSFANYLNLLRIEYFIILAKNDPTIRKFTIKAIASEVGFSNSESFSKAFYKHKGLKPSYFLKELENSSKI